MSRPGDPRVSVVMIFLNEERFIEEAIASVLAQAFTDLELLLVDDGSTDASPLIAGAYAGRYSNISYLEHPQHANCGMSASRNLGIASARGEYIAFLDADDVWLPEKLAEQVTILDRYPAVGMVYGSTEWWFDWTSDPADSGRNFIHGLGVPPDSIVRPPDLLHAFLLAEGFSPCTCSMLVRRSVAERLGGFEAAFRGLYEDQVFSAKVCASYPVYASGACRQRYRQHPGSACSVAVSTGEGRAERERFLTWLEGWLTEQDLAGTKLLETVRRERWRNRRVGVFDALRHVSHQARQVLSR